MKNQYHIKTDWQKKGINCFFAHNEVKQEKKSDRKKRLNRTIKKKDEKVFISP